MKKAKLLTGIALALTMGSLVACGGKETKAAGTSKVGTSAAVSASGSLDGTASTDLDTLLNLEVDNTETAMALHQKLTEAENTILTENKELWEKVFLAADKGSAMIEDGSNYGDFLLKTIEDAKGQFSEEELKTLRAGAEKIQKIEGKLTILEQKYPESGAKPDGGNIGVPAENGKPVSDSSLGSFPAFEGQDLDGNAVKSSELFGGNTVTVVNFWFTSCRPCVEELSALDALNKQLAWSASTALRWTAMRLRLRRQKMCLRRRARATGTFALIRTRTRGSLRWAFTLSRPAMWSTKRGI